MIRRTGMMAVVAVLGALLAAGCGGGGSGRTTVSRSNCRATVGFEGPIADPLGRQQLALAQLAVARDNARNRIQITLAPADTRLNPARAIAATDQFVSRPGIVAVVGPASDGEVAAVGPTFARAGLAFVSGSATGSTLADGANPTFFRVVAADSLQGPQEARFVVSRLRPRAVMLIDDRGAYSVALVQSMIPVFRSAKVLIDHESVNPRSTARGQVLARITPAITVVILAWPAPLEAQQFGRALLQQHKAVTIVGPDRLYAPGTFTLPGAYVTSFAPDIRSLPADASLVVQIKRGLGEVRTKASPVYAATHVIDEAVAAVCRNGQAPSRSGVLAAARATNQSTSILGIPIRFEANGNLAAPRWFLFRIGARGAYRQVKNG